MRRLVASFLAVIVLCFGIALASASGDSPRPVPVEHPTPTAPPIDHQAQLVKAQAVIAYAEATTRVEVGSYIFARQISDVVAYTRARAQADLARYVASIPRPAPVRSAQHAPAPPPAPSSGGGGGGGGGGACGGATNGADRFIQRESGGSPSVANPSGAYGCYQIMPSTWSSSCSDLGGEIGSAPSTQAACASRLPLSAWNASGPTG